MISCNALIASQKNNFPWTVCFERKAFFRANPSKNFLSQITHTESDIFPFLYYRCLKALLRVILCCRATQCDEDNIHILS